MNKVISQILPDDSSEFNVLSSLRLKITDKCHWNCWWCHNEGSGSRTEKLVRDLDFNNPNFTDNLLNLASILKIKEMHLTGGEPTLHPDIVEIVKFLKSKGFIVKMTSVGNDLEKISDIVSAGIDSINFSLHAISQKEMVTTQIGRSERWIAVQHKKLINSILKASESNIDVKINTVISSENDFQRVEEVILFGFKNNIKVRLLHEVNNLEKSISSTFKLLGSMQAIEVGRKYTLGSSSGTIMYKIPDRGEVGFKILIPNYLNSMCSECKLIEKCGEYFYGIRIENMLGNDNIRLCVHTTNPSTYFRMEDFEKSRQFDELKKIIYKW